MFLLLCSISLTFSLSLSSVPLFGFNHLNRNHLISSLLLLLLLVLGPPTRRLLALRAWCHPLLDARLGLGPFVVNVLHGVHGPGGNLVVTAALGGENT